MIYQILTFFAVPALAQTDYGLYETAKTAELVQFGDNLPGLIGNVLGAALSLVGVLFFALMLYGGITWMMAHGNAEQEKKALSTIMAAIIGILIVLGSYALTSFVLGSLKSAGDDNSAPPAQESCHAPSDLCKDCSVQTSNSCGGPKCYFGSLCAVSGAKCAPEEGKQAEAQTSCANVKDAQACAQAHCEWK